MFAVSTPDWHRAALGSIIGSKFHLKTYETY